MFGTIWYKLDTSDVAGVQSLVSVIFMASLFIGALPLLQRPLQHSRGAWRL